MNLGCDVTSPMQEMAKAAMPCRPPTFTEQMQSEKSRLEERLSQINEVLDTLQSQPETQKLLDAVAKLGQLRY